MRPVFGAVDLGSNSVRCLGVFQEGRKLRYLFSGRWASRLSEGMTGEKRQISPEALERTMHALSEAKEMLRREGVPPSRTRFFATESLRSADGIEKVIPGMEKLAGVRLQVLDGDEEAGLSFEGALLGVGEADAVFDLGGGSLEVAGADFRTSFRLGAVRMFSLYGESAGRIYGHARKTLQVLPRNVEKLVGVGGTSSSAAMMMRKIPWQEYHPAKVHGSGIGKDELASLLARLKSLDAGKRRDVPGLEPSRADIIVSGLCVIEALLDSLKLQGYLHSETDLLWAQCARAAAQEGLTIGKAEY